MKYLAALLIVLILTLHAATLCAEEALPSLWNRSPAQVGDTVRVSPEPTLKLLELYVRGYMDAWMWATVEHKGNVNAAFSEISCVDNTNPMVIVLVALANPTEADAYASAVQNYLDQECWTND